MILIIGLGNPGVKYQNNRHNVGFQFVDYTAKLLNGQIVEKQKNNLAIYQFNNLILAKPQTFMNNSGTIIKKLTTTYSLQPTSLIVIHDDLDIPLGKFHIQFASGPQLHNGLESVEQHLKTKDFWRVRIGVDNRLLDKRIPGETYALQNFLPKEKKMLQTEIFPKIFTQLKLHLKNQFKILI